jgi:hypothetical protein
MEENPYAPPKSNILNAPQAETMDAESIRREHIGTETNLKSVGSLYYLGAFITTAIGVTMLGTEREEIAVGVLFLAFATVQWIVGFGMRRLRAWARIFAVIFSCLGLFAFPLGTLINGYILYLLLHRRGKTVMTTEYQRIIAATPHVRYRTSLWVWIILALVILAILTAVFLPALINK